MNRFLFLIVAFVLSHSGALYASPYRCDDVIANYKLESTALKNRLEIVRKPGQPSTADWLATLRREGKLLYKGNHFYDSRSAFLASNEFDWAKTPMDREPTDLFIGFGTNSAWDLAVRKRAKDVVIADWSPAPLLAQGFLVAPIMRVSHTPQEFIALTGGVPVSAVEGMSVSEAFVFVRRVQSGRSATPHGDYIRDVLNMLAQDSRITNEELRFLTLYFQAFVLRGYSHAGRESDFGPFKDMRYSEFANFNRFWGDRYHPQVVKDLDTVFSSQANFSYLKQLFDTNHVHFAMAEISDPNFYQALHDVPKLNGHRKITFSSSNIFGMDYHDSVGFHAAERVLKTILSSFPEQASGTKLTFFQTVGGAGIHNYFRYQINTMSDIRAQMKPEHFEEPEMPRSQAYGQGRTINVLGR